MREGDGVVFAMRLSQLMRLAAFKPTSAAALKIIRKYLSQFWGSYNLPTPAVKVVKRTGVAWAARCRWIESKPGNTSIEVNAYLASTEEQLEKALAHELIHHYQFLKTDLGRKPGKTSWAEAHGPEFRKWMAKINSVKGTDFVTPKSDEAAKVKVPTFIVLVKKTADGFGWMWAKRPSASMLQIIDRLLQRGWRKGTSQVYELTHGPRIGKRGAYATTDLDIVNNELKKVWEAAGAEQPAAAEVEDGGLIRTRYRKDELVKRRVRHRGLDLNSAQGNAFEVFLKKFYKKHPKLKTLAPKKILNVDKPGAGKHPEATQKLDHIELYPKFWKLPGDRSRFHVLAHEIGHYVLSKKGLSWLVEEARKLGIDVWEPDQLPFGQYNMEEGFADAFASYHTDGDVKRKYPAWAKLIQKAS